MPKSCNKLIVVAHPDDETIFFGGLLQRETRQGCYVVCATNGGADGRAAARALEFTKACKQLGVRAQQSLGLADIYEKRLDPHALAVQLADINKQVGPFKEVYTHSIVGDYGHPHHQDVAFATALAFRKKAKVLHVAWNAYPEKRVALTAKEFETKRKVMQDTYGLETQRFMHLLPCRTEEGFTQVSGAEIEEIYRFITRQSARLNLRKLKTYRGLANFLKTFGSAPMPRPF